MKNKSYNKWGEKRDEQLPTPHSPARVSSSLIACAISSSLPRTSQLSTRAALAPPGAPRACACGGSASELPPRACARHLPHSQYEVEEGPEKKRLAKIAKSILRGPECVDNTPPRDQNYLLLNASVLNALRSRNCYFLAKRAAFHILVLRRSAWSSPEPRPQRATHGACPRRTLEAFLHPHQPQQPNGAATLLVPPRAWPCSPGWSERNNTRFKSLQAIYF